MEPAPSRQLRALRRELIEQFPIRPAFYWSDLFASATIGWTSFAVAAATSLPAPMVMLAVVVASLSLWRAAYFVHEISHQGRALPGFELVWNAVAGVWLMMPSFMIDAHVDHHRTATYGTPADPEYEPVARYSRARLVASVAVTLVVPPLLVLRFAVIAPLSFVVAPLRRLALERMSALVTNERFRDRKRSSTTRTVTLELACAVVAWMVAIACVRGDLPLRVPIVWYAVTSLALACNQARTLVSHAYAGSGSPMSLEAQVADSATIDGPAWSTGLFHPVGTRFHAIHHLAPSLPYHALPAAHRWMLNRGVQGAYRATEQHGFASALRALWMRARKAPREPTD